MRSRTVTCEEPAVDRDCHTILHDTNTQIEGRMHILPHSTVDTEIEVNTAYGIMNTNARIDEITSHNTQTTSCIATNYNEAYGLTGRDATQSMDKDDLYESIDQDTPSPSASTNDPLTIDINEAYAITGYESRQHSLSASTGNEGRQDTTSRANVHQFTSNEAYGMFGHGTTANDPCL